MKKERTFDKVWNAESLLASYLYFADKDGYIQNLESSQDSSYKIRQQRFIAALRAYGRDEKSFYKPKESYRFKDDCFRYFISQNCSEEKINEIRKIVKENLHNDFELLQIDKKDFLSHSMNQGVAFMLLFRYEKAICDLMSVWSGVIETSLPIGMLMRATINIERKQLSPIQYFVNKILLLLMGDDFDKSFTEKELFQYGYPDVTDDEIYQIELDEF